MLVGGRYRLIEIIYFGGLAFVASYIIAGFLKWVVDKYKKESILLLVLIGVLFLAFVLMPTMSVLDLYKHPYKIYTFS